MGVEPAGSQVALIDTSAIIAGFADEPARQDVERVLNGPDARMSVISLVEVYDQLMRVRGESREAVDARIEHLRRVRALSFVPLDERLACRAGELRSIHYHHGRMSVSQADCVVLATAETLGDALATTDQHLADMARDVRVAVLALPDSTGRRP
jgi:PIN domain nuclease of toxin-antitoxin system